MLFCGLLNVEMEMADYWLEVIRFSLVHVNYVSTCSRYVQCTCTYMGCVAIKLIACQRLTAFRAAALSESQTLADRPALHCDGFSIVS